MAIAPMTTPSSHRTIRWKWSSLSRPRERSHRSRVCTSSDDAAETAAISATVLNTGRSTLPASPLGAVTDSLLIAERIDEVVYVCRFNRAYRKHIRLYMRALRNGKNEVLGIVLNGLSPRRIEYYSNYRYYRSYKKYYGAQT